MPKLKVERLEEYLLSVYKKPVKVLRAMPMGGEGLMDLKWFGYGVPYFIEFSVDGEIKRAVLETMRPEEG